MQVWPVGEDASSSRSQRPVRFSLCRLCNLLSRRNGEMIVGEWFEL